MTRRYLGDLDSENEVVDKGTYTVEVADARAVQTGSGGDMLWIDLKVIGGPDDGRVVSVSCNLPRDGEKGVFFLRKRLRGWNPQIVAKQVHMLPDEDQPDAIAEAIIGTKVEADLALQTEGQYKGSQQLDETRQIVGRQEQVAVAVETPVMTTSGQPDTDPPF